MKKRLILFLFTMLTTVAKADWSLSSDGVLTVTSDYSYWSYSDYPWYNSRSDIKSVVIADGVNWIGDYEFSGCICLTSVEIHSGVTSIGYFAFNGCSGLTSIEIPAGVTSIGNLAFYGCSGLESIIVNAENEVYDSRDNCNAIIESATNTLVLGCANTTIPSSVTSIGRSAFSGCSGLTSVKIPSSVTSIGREAFSGCSGLTSVEIPSSVTSIGSGAFWGCSGLTSVEIPSSVTSIGYGAFMDCSGLTSVTINNPVPLSLGGDVFFDYSSYDVLPNLKIYVPKEAVEAYKEDESWSEYADIIFAIPTPTAVESIDAEKSQKVIKTIEDGKIVIIRNGVKWDLSGKKIDMK